MTKTQRLTQNGFGYEGPEGAFYSDKVAMVFTRRSHEPVGHWGPAQYSLTLIERIIRRATHDSEPVVCGDLPTALKALPHSARHKKEVLPLLLTATGAIYVEGDIQTPEMIVRVPDSSSVFETLVNAYYLHEWPPVPGTLAATPHGVMYTTSFKGEEYTVVVAGMNNSRTDLVGQLKKELRKII